MRALLSLLLVSCIGCGDPPPPRAEAARAPPVAAPRTLAGAAAFALVPSDDAALLVWGSEEGVFAEPLGPRGTPGARTTVAAGARAVELEAASLGRRIAVAWISETLRTSSAFSSDGGRSFTAPEELGESVAQPAGTRGRLALASNGEGRMTLFHRLIEAPCVGAETGPCARIRRHGVGGAIPATERGMEVLEVRHPCEPLVSGTRWHAGTWYYAICDRDHTTLYSIRDELQWASPFEVPCVPVGIAPLDHGVAATMRCGDGSTTAHVLDAMGGETARLPSPARSVTCAGGVATVHLGDRHTLRLAGALDHVETLLAEEIAPRGARAIWTGEALLVAHVHGTELRVRRYECAAGDVLARTDGR
jgi:hypothetical protein